MKFKFTAKFMNLNYRSEDQKKELAGSNPVEMFEEAPPSYYRYDSNISLETPEHLVEAVENAGYCVVKSSNSDPRKVLKCASKKSAIDVFNKTKCVVLLKKLCVATVHGAYNVIVSAKNKCYIGCSSQHSIIANVGKLSRLVLKNSRSIVASAGDRCTIDGSMRKGVAAITGERNNVIISGERSIISNTGNNAELDPKGLLMSVVASTGHNANILSSSEGNDNIFVSTGDFGRIISKSPGSIAIGAGMNSYAETIDKGGAAIVAAIDSHAKASKAGAIAMALSDWSCASGVYGSYLLLGNNKITEAMNKFVVMYVDDKIILSNHRYTLDCKGRIIDLTEQEKQK